MESIRKIILSATGACVLGSGVGTALKSGFGADAFGILWEGTSSQFNISIGGASIVVTLICVLIVYFLDKKQIGVSTLINPFFISFSTNLTFNSNIEFDNIFVQFVVLLVGISMIGIGSGISSAVNYGKDGYNALVLTLSKKLNFKIAYVRSFLDLACFLIGVIMGGTFSIGPIIGICLIGGILQKTISICKKFSSFH